MSSTITKTGKDSYPKATQEARRFGQALKNMMGNASPSTEIATVVDTSFHVAAGYITATSHKGPVPVIGVPINSVCPGMRIMIRRMTQGGLNYYVFDGLALAAATVGTTSGAIASLTGLGPAAANSSTYGSGTIANGSPLTTIPSGGPTNSGWFWSFFFYVASLPPAGSPCVLLDMPLVNASWQVTGGFRVTYDYQGHINAYFYGSLGTLGVGTGTTQVFAPHRVWFATLQLGNGLAINGSQYANMSISNLVSSQGIAAGNYGMFLLSDSNGSNAAPAGSWISKVTFGCDYSSGAPIWPYALNGSFPTTDSAIITGSAALGSGLTVYNRWLISDGSGTTIPGTGLASLTLQVLGSQLTLGPY